MEKEIKSIFNAEIKTEGEEGIFEGYAAYFNNVDTYNDVILPDAFDDVLSADISEIKVVFNHDWEDVPIGIPIQLWKDENGLKIKAKLIDTSKGKDVKIALKEKAITKMSIGYTVLDYEYKNIAGKTIRYIKKIKLYEISPVLFPANNKASIQNYKKEKEGGGEVEKEIKTLLRDISTQVKQGTKKVEIKGLETQIPLETLMIQALIERGQFEKGSLSICSIYLKEFVLNHWGYMNENDDSWFDKYYRVSYNATETSVQLTSEVIEVTPSRTYIDKKAEYTKIEEKKEENKEIKGLNELLEEMKKINKK